MKKFTFILIIAFMAGDLFAQSFNMPLQSFSRKKKAFIHKTDGTVQEGFIDGFKRKKGVYVLVKMKDEEGNKSEIPASEISHAFLAPSALGKISAKMEKIHNINRWDRKINQDTSLINEGYVFFEKTKVEFKKGTEDLLLQLLNPSFCSDIKVYFNPRTQETASVSAGPSMGIGSTRGQLEVAGGEAKSYYVKIGDKPAFKLKKGKYKKMFMKLYGDSPEFVEKYGKKGKWRDFAEHLYYYTEFKNS